MEKPINLSLGITFDSPQLSKMATLMLLFPLQNKPAYL